MKKGLLRLILTNLSVIMIFLAIVACFQGISYTVNDGTGNKNAAAVTQVVKYDTIEIYDESIPNNITKTVVEGVDGLYFINNDGGATTLKEVVNEEVVVGTGKYGVYKGIMTGYGPDCVTCDGLGYVACATESGKSFNIITDGIYYNDDEFGEVRVLAAALAEFPCGTIIEITNSDREKEIVVVLDTGSGMRNAYSQGWILIDLAFEKEALALSTTNKNTHFEVKRWGW